MRDFDEAAFDRTIATLVAQDWQEEPELLRALPHEV
jgi:hypothetical protein